MDQNYSSFDAFKPTDQHVGIELLHLKKKGQFLALGFPTLEMARLSQTLALDLDSI